MSPRTTLPLLALLSSLCACTRDPDPPKPEPSLPSVDPSDPPRIDQAELSFLNDDTSDNALLEVRFLKGELKQGAVEMELDGQAVVLRDDGEKGDREPKDGIYSAIVDYDLQAEAQRRLRYLERVPSGATVTHFEHRNASTREPFDPQDVALIIDGKPQSPKQVLELNELEGHTLMYSSGSSPLAPTTDPEKTLAIRDVSVTRDAARTGVWTRVGNQCQFTGDAFGVHGFSHLMEEMADGAGISTADWTANWLRTWDDPDLEVNDQDMPRLLSGLEQLWNRFPHSSSDGDAFQFTDQLDMSRPPFALVAIVNRVDLHQSGPFNGDAGELRYVFQAIDPTTCEPEDMTVIFEYAVPRYGCLQTRSYAQSWYALDGLPLGSQAYRDALELITESVVTKGANPDHASGSALRALRTNSRSMPWPHYPSLQWHMREFINDGAGLQPAPLTKTPAFNYEYPSGDPLVYDWDQAPINAFITTHLADILADDYEVPLVHDNQPMRAGYIPYGRLSMTHHFPHPPGAVAYYEPHVSRPGANVTPGTSAGPTKWSGIERGQFWGSGVVDVEARHRFSLNSCNGCHAREVFDDAGTLYQDYLTYGLSRSVAGASVDAPFMHMRLPSPVSAGPAEFSRFLTGTNNNCTTSEGLVAPLGSEVCSADCCPVGDPVHGPTVAQYHYNDLARRGQELESLVHDSCFRRLVAEKVQPALAPAH